MLMFLVLKSAIRERMKMEKIYEKTLKTILFILAACVLAIASKKLLSSEVNAEDFNSLLVLMFGFPIVATSYFVMIYTHNAVVTKWFSKNARLSNLSCGLRTGISFGLIYLLVMEEVVVEASPFAEWEFPFVKYQFVMGIGEAYGAVLKVFKLPPVGWVLTIDC